MKYNLVNYCEIDKYASLSYSSIHNEPQEKNLGDITQVDISKLPKVDFLSHGSPCTDFSLAGKQAGGNEGSGTRSSLMWNSVEIIKQTKPKFVIWENVSNVLNGKHRPIFEKYLTRMNELGYANYYKVMTASDYSLPQSRKRIFVLSIRNDIDKGFIFPEPVRLLLTLRDLLENNVDSKYNLSERALNGIMTTKFMQGATRIQKGDICQTLLARDYKDPKCVEQNGVVRKLTPLEYWRIQGFTEKEFKLANKVVTSNAQLYKQAGNSIAVTVLEHIYRALVEQYPNDFTDGMDYISLFSGIGAFEVAMNYTHSKAALEAQNGILREEKVG